MKVQNFIALAFAFIAPTINLVVLLYSLIAIIIWWFTMDTVKPDPWQLEMALYPMAAALLILPIQIPQLISILAYFTNMQLMLAI